MPQAPGEPNQLRKCEKLPFAVPLRPRTHHPAARAPGVGARPRSAPRHVVDPAHFGQRSALSALVSQASVRPLSGGGDSRTGTHQNEQSVGTADCVAITLRTFANMCHVRRWKPSVTSLETRLSPKASVSAAICCAVLHSEPTISEIRAVFVACAERWFPCVPTASVSRE